VVSEKPATWTPQVLNGAVNAITQVGNTIVIGGTFTKASQVRNGAEISRPYIMAFDANTGVISTTFAPKLDSQVMSLAPGPDGKSVFVGGTFTSVNGQAVKKLVKLDITNGQRIGAFTATTDGPVRTLKVSGDELYVGGSFSHLAGAKRKMLGAVNVGTGAIDKSLSFTISGTHNGGSTGITAIDINPAGTKLVAIGNFTSVNGNSRDQIFLVDLGSQATLSNWSTTRLQTQCAKGWKSYAQAVDFAPDGSWFALASSGGAFKNSVCDSVSRWSITSESPGQHELWADYTGGDSLLSVAVTPNAVYVGGHQRWMNNPDGHNDAGPGAVARSGIAAVDPGNGLPLPWNPGRTRGRGAAALLATSSGLWVGSDTTWLGGFYHARIGFFPAS
jgi:hypothetical protein